MICKPCKKGADGITQGVVTPSESMQQHSLCKGCDCQHKVRTQVSGETVRGLVGSH